MTSSERVQLTYELFRFLSTHPGKNKKELLTEIKMKCDFEFTYTDVNSVLYGNKKLFSNGNESPPIWQVKEYKAQITFSEELDLSFYQGHKPRKWQIEAIETWISRGRRGVVEAVTGTGKTTVGILAAADAVARGLNVIIIVPGLDLLDQWYERLCKDLPSLEVGKFGGGSKDTFECCHVIISTINSARRNVMFQENMAGLLIADEVHGYAAEISSLALEEEFEERLGLTATYERSDAGVEEKLCPYFSPIGNLVVPGNEVIYGCGFKRGLEEGILAPFRVGMIGIDLEIEEQMDYDILYESLRKKRRQLMDFHNCPQSPFGEFMKAVHSLSEGGNKDFEATVTARSYLDKFTKRRKLLAESSSKKDALELIVAILNVADRTIIFTETIDSSISAAALMRVHGIMAESFSSGLKKEDRSNIIDAFKHGEIKVLAAPHVLDQGIDVPEVDVGVITAATHSKLQMIQRMGRIIRPKKDGRPATFFILYFKNTSEDPEMGAHGSFLDEMVEHAANIKDFREDYDNNDIVEWYKKGILGMD